MCTRKVLSHWIITLSARCVIFNKLGLIYIFFFVNRFWTPNRSSVWTQFTGKKMTYLQVILAISTSLVSCLHTQRINGLWRTKIYASKQQSLGVVWLSWAFAKIRRTARNGSTMWRWEIIYNNSLRINHLIFLLFT